MAMPLLGQFDPVFTRYMNDVMALYRRVFRTANRWTFLIDGTARAGIEAAIVSIVEPGDKVYVPIIGRFGHLLVEIARRAGADVVADERAWGTVFDPADVVRRIKSLRPKLVAMVQGDTSTTMNQPLEGIGAACREVGGYFYVDATASIGGNDLRVDEWQIDACTAGLQKCLSGPPGSAPITLSDRFAEAVERRRHVEQGIRPDDAREGNGPRIASNYFDLAMLMQYWSEMRLNHHTEATSMLYAARECARLLLQEGLDASFARHAKASRAVVAGAGAMGLAIYGDRRHKMANVTGLVVPEGIDADASRAAMLADFGIEIGASFGPLRGKVWRVGAMGHACRKENILLTLGALEATLRRQGYGFTSGAGVDAALAVYR
jgi:(S)-ureidoglycine-glyoxylate aminotransferase